MYVPAQHGLLLKHQLLLLHACFNLLLENVSSYYRMCSLTTECVLLLQNVFSSLECVLLIQNVFSSLVPAQHGLLLKRLPLLLHACFNLLALLLARQGILQILLFREENTFCSKGTHSVVREHIL